jgi:hypothetical protein
MNKPLIQMKTHLFFSLLISGILPFSSNLIAQDLLKAKADVRQIEKVLVMNHKWVPYPEYTDRAAWADLLKDNAPDLVGQGTKKIDYQWQPIVASAYLEYERTGNRNIMQDPDNANVNALSELVLAELAEGKGRFIDKIIDGVFFQCERTSWVISAHLPSQLSKRSLPDHTDQYVDLVSGDIGSLLAWTYYFFHKEFDKVNPIISKRLYDEIYRKIIIPYRTEDRFWWMGYNPQRAGLVNNWNPWCNSNVLQCMMLLESNQEQLGKDVYRTMLSVDKFINYIKKDGACEEGPSYWGHAAGKLYDYLQLLNWITGGEISLFDNKLIKDMGEYISRSYIGNDWVVNFADASAKFSSDAGLIYRYGHAVNSEEMKSFAAYLVAKGKAPISKGRDMLHALESLAYDTRLRAAVASHITPDITIYPKTQFYYVKNATGFFMATKGGFNEESHNHNDIGTVSLSYKETPILIDAGVGTYTRQTFGPERYSIWTMRSNYHNLPDINGFEQKNGREYKASAIKFNEQSHTFSVDISGAYPKKANVDYWTRSYQLMDDGLIIKDDFSLKAAIQPNIIHFMLWGKIDISQAGKVLITVEDKQLALTYDKALFKVNLDTIALDDPTLSSVWGKEIYRLSFTAKKQETQSTYEFRITATLTPHLFKKR